MTSHQGWSDISIWYKQNDSFMVGGDVGYRTTFDAFSFHQLYIRPTIRYRINPIFSVAFAVSTFHTLLDDAIDLNELRLAQQASIRWPKLGPLKFSQRIRLEERFYLIESTQANLQRVRYRLKMAPPEFFLFKKTRPFYSAITWETFVNIGSNFERYLGNSHRYEFVLGNKVSDKISIGLHYILQTTFVADDSFELKDDVIRLRMAYTFIPKKR